MLGFNTTSPQIVEGLTMRYEPERMLEDPIPARRIDDSAAERALQDEFNYLQNPSAQSGTVQEKIMNVTTETKNKKRNAFYSAITNLEGTSQMQRNALNYSGRNEDVLKMSQFNLGKLSKVATGNQYNKDLTRRQAEINDWYYQDKLETLYFLQIFFMTLLSMAIVYYFLKSGFITTGFAGFLTVTLFIIVGITGVYRYTYTSKFRDSRWWHKRRFSKPVYKEERQCGCIEDPFVPPKVRCPAKDDPDAQCMSGLTGATPLGLSSIFSRDPPMDVNSNEPGAALERASQQLERETVAYIQGQDLPSSSEDIQTCAKTSSIYQPGSTNVSLNRNVLPYM